MGARGETAVPRSRTAVITGAGRGLGRRLAAAFAERGFDVAVHYHESRQGARATAAAIMKSGRRAIALEADLSRVADTQRLAAAVARWTSSVDVLVNNAAIFPRASFEAVTEEMWDRTFDINLRSIFFLTRAFVPLLRAAPGPAVVNVASLGAFRPWRNHLPYNISKAGVVMLTRGLAKELAPAVRVNAVAPGILDLPGEKEPPALPENRIPLGRYGTPEEYVDAVLFLALSPYITGHVLPLDGGMSEAT